MAEEIHDECGIAGVYFFNGSQTKNVVPYLYKMLLNLQNRGQLSAGISTYSDNRSNIVNTYKEIGTVNEVFHTKDVEETKKIFEKYDGRIGIGHVRYSTFGLPSRSYAHPFERKHGRKCKWFSFCFNGNIANFNELKFKLMEKKEYHMIYNSDTEIILHYLSVEIGNLLYNNNEENKIPDLKELFSNISKKFDGAYSLAYMDAEGRLAAVRDPLGIRPLCYSIDDEKVMFASESVALSHVGCKNIKSLEPGEILIAENNEVKIERYTSNGKKAHCMFEYIYFSNIASTIENRSVYEVRTYLGKELAKLEYLPVNPNEYVVVSVPDSSKPFGEGYAYYFGLPHKEGLVRNRFVGRTFIEGNGRKDKIKNKFSLIKEVIKGKKVLLMDDSIIRGNTSKNLIDYLRKEGGAKEIHLRISCPAVVSPCFYGIDMSTISELIASKYVKNVGENIDKESSAKLAKELGADSILYQNIENIPNAIGIPRKKLCMACIDGKYPTEQGKKLCKKSIENYKLGLNVRTYEG
ncbi:amidophosphoribosyltransferase [archaeon]|nr:amidophosphoribosyltransferase [archaeon]